MLFFDDCLFISYTIYYMKNFNTLQILFSKKTVKLALKNVSQNKGGPFAAIIVKDNKIIASAVNNVVSKNDPTAHAEIEAIRKAAKKLKTYDLSNCEIYTSCQPCPMCLSAIYWANIKKVFYCADMNTAQKYGFRDKFIFKELSKEDDNKKVKQYFIDDPDKEIPFIEWKELPDKKNY